MSDCVQKMHGSMEWIDQCLGEAYADLNGGTLQNCISTPRPKGNLLGATLRDLAGEKIRCLLEAGLRCFLRGELRCLHGTELTSPKRRI
ncbi:UNVERIFIED_CONTAM: hypothetical protein Slati_4469700 [Sesamum latifolium]|uniref:Uncharacterized protein n=1 Tax=Sesamum latifolium TaxID=2727402 RepID=A0AAW2SRC6_9LAMI